MLYLSFNIEMGTSIIIDHYQKSQKRSSFFVSKLNLAYIQYTVVVYLQY